jgi:hypothetical protein
MILRSFSMITGAGYCAKFKSDSDGIISRSAKKISETLCIGFTSFSGNGRSTCVEGGWHHVGILSLKFTDRLLGPLFPGSTPFTSSVLMAGLSSTLAADFSLILRKVLTTSA